MACETVAVFSFVRNFFRGFSLLTLCVLLVPATVFACILGAFIFLPLPATLPTPKQTTPSEATKIYDVNGAEIASFQTFDQNIPIQESDIPEVLKQALISSEDRSFYEHDGVDVKGSFRALWADVRNKGAVQGGSTITQQYVKNAYLDQDRTLTRKVREAILASQLDRQMPKDEILYNYLSTTYFGNGAYGVGAAAQTYFRKPVKDLTASESAVLVGLIPSPTAWEPRGNPNDSEARRKSVLSQMQGQGYLTQQQYDEAAAQVEWLVDDKGDPGDAPATKIYGFEKTESKYPYFVDYVRKYLVLKYGEEKVLAGGLRVQTTLDPKLQGEAEASVATTLKGTADPLSMSLVSVEPQTGFVKALVGGRDWNVSQVNLALGGCPSNPLKDQYGTVQKVEAEPTCWKDPEPSNSGTGRQPGSSFKPFTLAAAYEQGVQPNKVYPAPRIYVAPNCKGAGCAIGNSEGESFGPTTIKEAMAHSINTVYAPLTRDVGFVQTSEMASRLGVTAEFWSSTLNSDSGTWALGTNSVSPLDMAAAYSVFANRGMRQNVTPIVKIVDSKDAVVEDNTARKGQQVISEAVADNVTDALKGVIDHGTAANSANIGRPAAGKTGTTDNNTDVWFVGYTPTLSTAVWMGYRNSANPIVYRGNSKVFGAGPPALTWASYMKQALTDVPSTDFSDPAPIQKPNANVLAPSGRTAITSFSASQQRTPVTTPTGDYDRTSNTPPAVAAPTASTTSTSMAPGSGDGDANN